MKIITLHDAVNENEIVPFDAASFDIALPHLRGSMLKLKDSDALFAVRETPAEILALLDVQ
jgi:hypothetical protein